MKYAFKIGFGFGLTSGIITTLGLLVGLDSSTHSKLVVIGGILTIAIADAFSDALGIHISEEAGLKSTVKEIWQSTFATFFSKLVFALTFVVPILLFELEMAVKISILWGLFLISIFSYYVAKSENEEPWKVIGEHLLISILVIVLTYAIGSWIGSTFI